MKEVTALGCLPFEYQVVKIQIKDSNDHKAYIIAKGQINI